VSCGEVTMNKSYSMSQWMTVMKEQGIGNVEKLQDVIQQDFTKWARLRKLNEVIGLPIDKHTHFSAEQFLNNAESVCEFFSQYDNALFSIKAEPIEEFKKELPRHRDHGISKEECIEFVKNLKPDPNKYKVSIWKYFESQISGIIVVNKKDIVIEIVPGKHSILTQGWKGAVVTARYSYNAKELNIEDKKMRSVAEKALECVKLGQNSEILTHHGFVAGYFEFLYNNEDGFRFIDYNTTKTMSSMPDEQHVAGIVKGMVASSGDCQGIVRIVRCKEDFDKVKEGNILVTKMTDPSFIPILGKVVAVITDFGGLTCHAAIVSREFGLPCIVGTENATEVLKDGDLVKISDGSVKRI